MTAWTDAVEGSGVIELTDEMRDRLAAALDDGVPVVLASVDAGGAPHLSFYGSTHVHSADQLAIWVRDPAGGLLQRVGTNPNVALMYRNPAARLAWQFQGRARLVDDPGEARRVYDESPEVERGRDPERLGRAVVVDVDRVRGRDVLMAREPG